MFEQITILAPGLIGASVAMASKEKLLARRITVWSRRAETRVACSHQPWCDKVFEHPGQAVAGSDFILVCSPVESIYPLVSKITGDLKKGAIVTDVGSTKSLICRFSSAVISSSNTFIGSHPMAGSEKTGMAHARADLFVHKPCFVTPLVDSDVQALDKVVNFWKELEMEVATVSPEKHDEIVANISHLPHILASTLCSYLASKDHTWRSLAGTGLRDTTRIASGDPNLWKSIIEQNRDEIICAINDFDEELHVMKTAIANDQHFEVINLLERGKKYRDRLRLSNGKSDNKE